MQIAEIHDRGLSLPSRESPLWRWGGFAVFVCLAVVLAIYHEPWRDEAQAWLLARDADPWTLVSYLAGQEASPVLWHVFNMPLARLDLPYSSQRILNLAFAAGAAALVLWRAPFPIWLRIGIVLSYQLLFLYSGIARSYAMGAFFLFLLAALDTRRGERPVAYGTVIALLANCHVFGFLTAAGFGLAWLGDLRTPSRRLMIGLAIALAGGLLALWQILPPEDNWRGQGIAPPFGPNFDAAFAALGSALSVPQTLSRIPIAGPLDGAGAAALGLWAVLLLLLRSPRAWLIFGVLTAGILYIAVWERVVAPHHAGHLLLAYVAALWVCGPAIWVGRHSPFLLVPKLSLAAVCLLSIFDMQRGVRIEVAMDYSGAPAVASYLRENGLATRNIAAYPAPWGSGILPFLPEKTVWYPESERFGTYVVWTRDNLRRMETDEILSSLGTDGALSDPLLILPKETEHPRLRLLLAAPGYRESLYLYDIIAD